MAPGVTGGGRNIASAVELLSVSLDNSEEASVHVAQVKTLSTEIFALYRQALEDSHAPEVAAASRSVDAVSKRAEFVLGLLDEARKAIREYANEIAPRSGLTNSGKIRRTPSTEEVLDTLRRPRSLQQLANTVSREGNDAANLINSARADVEAVIDLIKPPDSGGFVRSTSTPVAQVGGPAPGTAGSGDATITAALTLVAAIKILQVTVDQIRKFFRRRGET